MRPPVRPRPIPIAGSSLPIRAPLAGAKPPPPAARCALAVTAALAMGACGSHSRTPAVAPATNNLAASVLQVATAQPRIGYPLEVVTFLQATETTSDVSVSYYAQNGEDVAQQLEQVRQFYLGTVTFPSVQPSITEYRAQLNIPTSVTPPGNYVILASIDPSNLVRETNEDDNLAEIATTFTPVQDPNLAMRKIVLDYESILLDADVDDVPGTQTQDVQNADLGATLTIGLEGTLAPVPIEVFVRLRITRTDLPPGQDTYDVPLYLWDSDAQKYIDAYGINGPVEWLRLGSIDPQRVTESETDVDVKETGAYSGHLDVYLPGKLAEVMITILEHLVAGPPPTVPPPDLRLQDIFALQAFFAGASQSHLQFSIVADVRAVDSQFQDTNPADNSAAQTVFLILPGQESMAPDRPLAFQQGCEERWGSDKFGVGFGFDSFASVDGRGAIAEVEGGLAIEVFGSTFDFMHLDARAQVVPAVDPAATAGQTSGFFLDLEFASITVYSFQKELGYTFDGSFSISKEKSFSKQFFVGPVPVSTTGGVAGELGYQLTANLQPTSLACRTGPYATLEATIEAGVGILGLRAGAGGGLTLIDERFEGNVLTGLTVVHGAAPAIFQGSASMQVGNAVTGPTGRIFLFVEYPGVKWCRACILGACFPFPCGIKTVRKEWGLVSWVSFVKEDVLFDQSFCKRVTIQTSPTFSSCIVP